MRWKLIALCVLAVLAWSDAPHTQETRQFYLSPIDGAGTEADPWHSRALGMPDAGCVDLRPYGFSRFLCASTDLPANTTGVIQIGASQRSALGARKAVLEAIIGKSLAANNVEDVVVEVLASRLRAGKDGKLKIYLGQRAPLYQQTAWVPFRDDGLVADLSHAALGVIEPTLAWAATFHDSFTGADGNLAGDLSWTEFLDTVWARASNKASASGASSPAGEARADHDTDTDDQEVQADLAYTYTSGGNLRCAVLGRKDATTTRDFYQFGMQRDTGVDVYRLLERNAGSPTTLADSVGATASAATVKLIPDGTSISGYVNGVLTVGPVTDATISGNTRAGLAYVGGSGDSCTADNFRVADTTARSRGGSRWLP